MCKASVLAKDFRDPEEGDVLGIYVGEHGLGTFKQDGTRDGDCATCLQTGDRLTLEDIPPAIQQHLGISSTETATFIETPGSVLIVVHDLLWFDNHPKLKPVPVAVFADVGVTAYVNSLAEDALEPSDVLDDPVDDVPVGDSPIEMARRLGKERIAA